MVDMDYQTMCEQAGIGEMLHGSGGGLRPAGFMRKLMATTNKLNPVYEKPPAGGFKYENVGKPSEFIQRQFGKEDEPVKPFKREAPTEEELKWRKVHNPAYWGLQEDDLVKDGRDYISKSTGLKFPPIQWKDNLGAKWWALRGFYKPGEEHEGQYNMLYFHPADSPIGKRYYKKGQGWLPREDTYRSGRFNFASSNRAEYSNIRSKHDDYKEEIKTGENAEGKEITLIKAPSMVLNRPERVHRWERERIQRLKDDAIR